MCDAVAMATGAITSLVLGKQLGKPGLPILLLAFGIPAFSSPLVFLYGTNLELIKMILRGIGIGAHDSCLKAVLAPVVPSEKRRTAFGGFDTSFWYRLTWLPGRTAPCRASPHSSPRGLRWGWELFFRRLPAYLSLSATRSKLQ